MSPWLDALLDWEVRGQYYGRALAGVTQEREAVYAQLQVRLVCRRRVRVCNGDGMAGKWRAVYGAAAEGVTLGESGVAVRMGRFWVKEQ